MPHCLPRPTLKRWYWGALVFSALTVVLPLRVRAQDAANQESGIQAISTPVDLTAFIGKPIHRVVVVQTGSRWKSPVELKSVRVGEPLSAALGRRAARELLSTGAFASVRIEIVAERDGVELRLLAVPRRLVAGRRLVGSPIDELELWQEAKILKDGQIVEDEIAAAQKRMVQLLSRRGYPHASVSVQMRDTDDPSRVFVVVEVVPGPAREIARRVLVVPRDPSLEIQELSGWYAIGVGDVVDEVALDNADNKHTDQLHARGYVQAKISHRVVDENGRALLYVYVNPGPKLRFRFEGNRRFDADQLLDAIDYEGEPDRSPVHLAAKINAHYRSMGFYDVRVTHETRGASADRFNDLVFKIREGDLVRVAERRYPCLSGPRKAADVTNEIDSFLQEELPGSEVLGPVDPAAVDSMLGPTEMAGTRPAPLQVDPTKTFVPEVYDKAIKHLQDLYRSEGFLSATVGPMQTVRRACRKDSPPGACIPVAFAKPPRFACAFDPSGIPEEEPEPDPQLSCLPDALGKITCESELTLYIPVKLGPRATLFDVLFEGNRTLVEDDLAEAAALELGKPASNLALEDARRRILEAYREQGYAYASVRASLVLSVDNTRARAHFIISESERVIVDRIIIQGAEATSDKLIARRVALRVGEPFRQSLVRKTEERVATLGTFSTVTVALQDPYVPAQRKTVIIQVQERMPQYLDIRPGFSTGEGFRIQFEYGHRNIAGSAIQFIARARLGYLPDVFVLDPDVLRNLSSLPVSKRLERRNTVSVLFPEIGLGPLIALGVDGIDVRSNARDFGLSKNALSVFMNYRPVRQFTGMLGASAERNDVAIFNGESVNEYLTRGGVTPDLGRLLRVPDGLTYAIAQRATVTWDRRDNPFGATRGTVLGGGVEHVRSFPAEESTLTTARLSDFLRVTGMMAGYVSLSQKGLTLAMSVRGGYIVQLMQGSKTYPDRLFFLGGVDSVRGFLQDSLVPQDIANRISPDATGAQDDPRLAIQRVAIRGGDVFINPRVELRVPLTKLVQTALFLDSGNVWVDPRNFEPWALCYAAGSGIRLSTPVGPVALDYGINLRRRSWEDFGAFHFSIGVF